MGMRRGLGGLGWVDGWTGMGGLDWFGWMGWGLTGCFGLELAGGLGRLCGGLSVHGWLGWRAELRITLDDEVRAHFCLCRDCFTSESNW